MSNWHWKAANHRSTLFTGHDSDSLSIWFSMHRKRKRLCLSPATCLIMLTCLAESPASKSRKDKFDEPKYPSSWQLHQCDRCEVKVAKIMQSKSSENK